MEPGMSECLHAEFRRDLCLDSADAAAMDALVDARPETGVFLSREWLSGYFDHRLPGVEYGLLVLRDGRALRAVAPLTIRHALTQSRIGIVGGGMGSDRVDLLAGRDPAQVIGTVLRTREKTKPLYISPRHRIDVEHATAFVLACCRGYRLPEPSLDIPPVFF